MMENRESFRQQQDNELEVIQVCNIWLIYCFFQLRRKKNSLSKMCKYFSRFSEQMCTICAIRSTQMDGDLWTL